MSCISYTRRHHMRLDLMLFQIYYRNHYYHKHPYDFLTFMRLCLHQMRLCSVALQIQAIDFIVRNLKHTYYSDNRNQIDAG